MLGKPERKIIVHREHAYHGMALGTSLAGIPLNKAGYGTLVADTIQVDAHDLDTRSRPSAARSAEIAAFIVEPVIGAGGVIPPQGDYLAGLQPVLPPVRRAADRGRGHHRLRPHRASGGGASATASSPT
ncbi:MAG: aminotransferase class III-fold pyridoxal phosphate-dependent enzyme [Chloroflexota bacterium]